MPIGIPTPKWLLEIGAFLIRTETELILKSRFVVPERLLREGFKFKFDQIEHAVNDIVSKRI
jgi:NAD dependent epimerase/dehydratase family enzyme